MKGIKVAMIVARAEIVDVGSLQLEGQENSH